MVRQACRQDIPNMLELASRKREEYEVYAPTFWRVAPDASEKQALFFEMQLTRPNVICLVGVEGEEMHGFILASVIKAPPVYDPGTEICMVDDFTVSNPGKWETVGRQLLQETRRLAAEQGADLAVVVCGQQDEPKRQMLRFLGLYVASEWYVAP